MSPIFVRELRLQSCITVPVQLFVKGSKNPFQSVLYCWILTSASELYWQAVERWGLIVRARRGTELCYDDLYCSLISSLGFPLASSPDPPTHPLHCTALHHPPSVWRPCQTLWHMKTIVLVCLRRHNRLLRRAFPPLTEAQLTVGQTDFLLLLLLLLLLLEKVAMFSKNRKRGIWVPSHKVTQNH